MSKDIKEHQNRIRQSWGSRLGVILAVAGSAVGLGNFLRFPVQAVQNGGGAFMIPYFIALLLVGIPLMWIEWTIGRYGGGFGHGTAPGIFHSMHQKNRFIKYFGVIGMFGPLTIFLYYCYIESWLFGYLFYSLTPKYSEMLKLGKIDEFFTNYISVSSILSPAYIFFIITFILNFIILYFGIKGGIEKVATIAMPVLLFIGIIMAVRVLTLGITPNTQTPYKVINGLGFLWNPDFSALKNMKVWLAAAGQVFFTLSVGMGVIITYASYLKKENDVVLSGLASASTNEFVEVIIGGSIIIPAAFAFFGSEKMVEIAKGGAFSLSFITMPIILEKIPFTIFFSFLWFLLLFLAGVTSSISMLQPAITFFEDEFNASRKKAVLIIGIVTFILIQPVIFFIGKGVVDELDFWGGTFSLVLFATFEVIMFSWIFGIEKAWNEVHKGARMEVPKIYKFIIKYITPLFLVFILIGWFIQQGIPFILMKGVEAANKPFIIGARIGLLVLLLALIVAVKIAWKKYKKSR